jgi:parallel beta-helix repeat protein
MNQRSFAIFALAILAIQPLVVISTVGITTYNTDIQSQHESVLSQNPGTRLTPQQHTDHVPILIDGDSSFILQGWPGAGTIGSPWIISGLNISYDAGVPNIQIQNVDGYFVVRDCYLNQLTGFEDNVHLENVSHGTLEYMTLVTNGAGVTATNANNTIVSHLDITVGLGSGVVVDNSYYCTFDANDLYQGWRGFDVGECPSISISNNEIVNFYGDGIYVDSSNYSNIVSNLIHEVDGTGIVLSDSYYSGIFSNTLNNTGADGMFIALSEYALIQDNTVLRAGDNAIQFSTFKGISITSNTLNYTYSYPINVVVAGVSNGEIIGNTIAHTIGSSSACIALQGGNHENFTITDNYFEDQWGGLFTVPSGRWIDFSHNHARNMGQYLIGLQSYDDCDITDNTLDTSGSWGVYTTTCDRLNVIGNTITNVASAALYIGGANATVQSNIVSECGNNGISIQSTATNALVQYNSIEANGMGIDINAADCTVDTNTVKQTPYGIDVHAASDRAVVTNNIIEKITNEAIIVHGINTTVNSNTISKAETGISLSSATHPVLQNNIIDACVTGILSDTSTMGIFENNDMTDCSFLFPSGQTIVNLNHTFSNNQVNDKPLFYALNESGLSLDGSTYGEVILVNCSDVSISGGTFPLATTAFGIFYSDRVNISNMQVDENLYPMLVYTSVNLTIADSVFQGGSDDSAISAEYADGFSAENVMFQDLRGNGIYLSNADPFQISDSHFENIGGSGIFTSGCSNGIIQDVEAINATYGIQFYITTDTVINGSHFMWNEYGIYSHGMSDDNNVTFNNIHDNQYGIRMDDSYSWYIYNNTARWNDYGLYITATINHWIYNNTFALNTIYNGYDDDISHWDDGVGSGNYWDDYIGTGTYPVPGGTAVDHYPIWYMVYKPIINSPSDIYYAEGSEGNSITWRPYDNSLRNWVVKVDGSNWATGIWNFQDVTVNIDGLSYGTHTVVVTVWDVDQNSVSDTVIVHVYDGTPPVVKGPPSQWLFVGATGQTVKWQVSDLHPATYTLTVDGNSFSAGSWTAGTLSINVDGINAVGEHTLVLTIYDVDHNSAQDTVLVQVINDNVNPTIQQADNVTYVEGTTGNYISWNANDEYPDSYQVVFNGTSIAEESWGGSAIVINVDGLAPGTYEYTLTVYDMSGNSATSAVSVTVMPLIPTIPAGPIDWVLIAIVAAIAGGVVVVVALVYYLRKRR